MSLRHTLLGLLAQSPSSSYDLTKRFNQTLALLEHMRAQRQKVHQNVTRLLPERSGAAGVLVVYCGAGSRTPGQGANPPGPPAPFALSLVTLAAGGPQAQSASRAQGGH
jgi:hypothetical protein